MRHICSWIFWKKQHAYIIYITLWWGQQIPQQYQQRKNRIAERYIIVHHILWQWIYRLLPPQLFSPAFAIRVSIPVFKEWNNFNTLMTGYEAFHREITSSNSNIIGSDKVVALCSAACLPASRWSWPWAVEICLCRTWRGSDQACWRVRTEWTSGHLITLWLLQSVFIFAAVKPIWIVSRHFSLPWVFLELRYNVSTNSEICACVFNVMYKWMY